MNLFARMLGRISVVRKFQLLAVASLLAMGVPTVMVVKSIYDEVQAETHAIKSVPMGKAALRAKVAIAEARGRNAMVLEGNLAQEARRDEVSADVDKALDEMNTLLATATDYEKSVDKAKTAVSTWQGVRDAVRNGEISDPATSIARYTEALNATADVLDTLADESGYTYAPQVDVYHLQNIVFNLDSKSTQLMGRVRVVGVQVLAEGADPALSRVLEVELKAARDLYVERAQKLSKVYAANPDMKAALEADLTAFEGMLEKEWQLVQSVIDGAVVPQEELFEELTTLINDQGAQTDKMFDALLDLTNSYRSQSLWSMGVLGVLLLVMIGFTAVVLIAVGGGITSSVDTAKRAAVRIANLQLDNTLKATSNDELGALIGALSKMQDELKVRIERDQAVAKENSRIRQALDSTAGGMMIADPDGVIIYMNRSVERVLKEAESDLRTLLPNFSADKVLGSNFDVFHKDPGKQRKLIGGLTSMHVANIKVGRFSFELSASPIHAEDGSRLGTTLEWRDRSAESDFRHGLRNAAQRAAAGFLNARVEVRSQDVRYVELADIFNGLIETTGKAIHEVEMVMSALAENDLTQRSSAVLLGSFGELNDNMNRTADSLAMIIGEIQDAVREIAGSAAEISQGNQDLSARTEQAAATIEQTAAAMEELNDTVKQSAENARQATGLATKSAEVAADGGRVMSGVVGTMREIEAASKQMAEIITTIDGIAFQTNILALNAAVEAARAGEQGRGFAVVASEVRALAQRSAQAAKEIAELINSTVTKVGTGSSLVSTAGNRIEEIVTSAKKVADIIADISAATVEQARGIDEVSKAVSLMDEATQANSALVEEMAAAAESMSGQAKGLSEVTKRFKV